MTCSFGDFPSGSVVKSPPSRVGDTALIPGWGNKDPTCCGATKPPCYNYRASALWNPRATTREKLTFCNYRSLYTATNTQHSKNKTKQKTKNTIQKQKNPSILSMRGQLIKPNLCKDTEDCYWLLCVSRRWHLLTNRRLLKRNVMEQVNQYLIL